MKKTQSPKSILKSPLKPKILSPLKRNEYIDMINTLPEKMKPLSYQENVLHASGRSKPWKELVRNCEKWLPETALGPPRFF